MFTLIDLVQFCFTFPMKISISCDLTIHEEQSQVKSASWHIFSSSMSMIYFVCPSVLSQQTSNTGLSLSQTSYGIAYDDFLHMMDVSSNKQAISVTRVSVLILWWHVLVQDYTCFSEVWLQIYLCYSSFYGASLYCKVWGNWW